MASPVLSYLHSLMIPLTRACGANCRYCSFRQDDTRMLTFDGIESLIRKYYNTGIMEVLVESGQSLEKIPAVRQQWEDQGYSSFAHYLRDIGQLALENHLLPSLEVGPLTFSELEIVSPVIASVSVMIENVSPELAKSVQPGKSIDAKIETLSDAGLLQIPAHTGLLIGIGESFQDLTAAVDVIAEIHAKYRHIQSVTLQFVHSGSGAFSPVLRFEDFCALIRYCRANLPGVAVSVPVTAPAYWTEAIDQGIDDLGRLFEGTDGIDWEHDYPKITEIEKQLARKGCAVRPRFPARPGSFEMLHRSDKLWAVCREWLNKNDYAYYRK